MPQISSEELIRRAEARCARYELPITRARFLRSSFLELPCAAAFAFLAWKIHKEKTDALKNPELHGRTRKAWENPLSAPNLATDVFAISSAFFAADWVYTRMKLRKTIAKAFHNVVSGDVFERKQLERQARNQEQDSLQ